MNLTDHNVIEKRIAAENNIKGKFKKLFRSLPITSDESGITNLCKKLKLTERRERLTRQCGRCEDRVKLRRSNQPISIKENPTEYLVECEKKNISSALGYNRRTVFFENRLPASFLK